MTHVAHTTEQRLTEPCSVAIRTLFFIATLCVVTLQWISGNTSMVGVSNWLVPDGQTYDAVMDVLVSSGLGAMSRILPEQFTGFPVNPLLFLYYYPFCLLLGMFGYFFANHLLVMATAQRYTYLGILLTPYFLLSFALPSKDLMVLALFIPLLHLVTQRRHGMALMLSVALFLIRDGAGVVAFACIVAAYFAPSSPRLRLYIVLAGAAGLALLNEIVYTYLGETFIVARNLSIAQEGEFDLGDVGAANFLVRLFGNATNLAFRPVFLDITGSVPLMAIAYFLSGISEVVCLLFSVRTLWNRNSSDESSMLATLFLVSLVVISINPLVQPRYQLFFVVIMLGRILETSSVSSIAKTYLFACLLTVAAITGYVVSGIGLPAPYGWGQIESHY